MWLSLGGYPEICKNTPNKVYNSHVIVNNEGSIVAVYRKLHMFKVTLPGSLNLDETRTTEAGDVLSFIEFQQRYPQFFVTSLIFLVIFIEITQIMRRNELFFFSFAEFRNWWLLKVL
jgi:predicted amidohydrolase